MNEPGGTGADSALCRILSAAREDAEPGSGAAFLDLATSYLRDAGNGAGHVGTPLGTEQVAARFAESLPQAGQSLDAVVTRLRQQVIPESTRLAHPMYLGHQVPPPLPAAIWTEMVIAALNQSMPVWEMSPAATAIERQVIRWATQLVGWGATAGGTFTTGGTEATCTALLAARAAIMTDAWTIGVGSDPPVVVAGEHAHYSVSRAVGVMGLGTDRLIRVPSLTGGFEMDPRALATTLSGLEATGRRVLAVVATAGASSTGSFDDLESIGLECTRRGLWLHVDAAHGGAALLSRTHRRCVAGLEHARSVSWDAHKLLLVPLSAGMLLVRDEHSLDQAFTQNAPYIFAQEAIDWDQGHRSLLCSRRADALKLWVSLQRYGATGLGALYDHLVALTGELYQAILTRPDFEPVHAPSSNILCFRWVGDGSMTGAALDDANLALRERYNRLGPGWITTTILKHRRVLRVTVMNPRTTIDHLRALLDGLTALASKCRAAGQ